MFLTKKMLAEKQLIYLCALDILIFGHLYGQHVFNKFHVLCRHSGS